MACPSTLSGLTALAYRIVYVSWSEPSEPAEPAHPARSDSTTTAIAPFLRRWGFTATPLVLASFQVLRGSACSDEVRLPPAGRPQPACRRQACIRIQYATIRPCQAA